VSRRVMGCGPPGARIALVGEAPGADEERLGEPFVGRAGRELNAELGQAGIARAGCYVTNVSKTRPPGNDFRRMYYDDAKGLVATEALLTARRALVAELQARNPRANVVVALGEEALRALTGLRGITKWRGSIIATPAGKVVPTFHPAGILRMWEHRQLAIVDFKKALAESVSPEANLPETEFTVDPSVDQVLDYLTAVRPGASVSFDIETLGATVRCIGLSTDGVSAICIPFVSCRRPASAAGQSKTLVLLPVDVAFGSHWSPEDEQAILTELARVLEDPEIFLIAQNFPFDASMLAREFGIVCTGLRLDTMVAQHCCYCELPKSLAFLASFYTRFPFWKDHDATNDLNEWTYNCMDAVVTFVLCGCLENEMKEIGV